MVFTILYEDCEENSYESPQIIFCGVFETEILAEEWIDNLCNFTANNFTRLLANKTRSPIKNDFTILESTLNNKIFEDINQFGRYKNLLH